MEGSFAAPTADDIRALLAEMGFADVALDVERARGERGLDPREASPTEYLDALIFVLEQALWMPAAVRRQLPASADTPEPPTRIVFADDDRGGESHELGFDQAALGEALEIAQALRSRLG